MRAESVVQHQELLVERRAESTQLDGANWRHEREELLRLPETLVLAHGPHLLSGGKDEFEEDREGAVRVRVLHEEASVTVGMVSIMWKQGERQRFGGKTKGRMGQE